MAGTVILRVELQNEAAVIAGLQQVDNLADQLSKKTITLKLDGVTKQALALAKTQSQTAKAEAQAAKAAAQLATAREKTNQSTQNRIAAEAKLATQMEKTATAEEQARIANTNLSTQIEKTRTAQEQVALQAEKTATAEANLAVQQEKTATATQKQSAAQDEANSSMDKGTKSSSLLGDSLGKIALKMAVWQVMGTAISKVISSFRDAVDTMKEVDSELTNIQKVTDMTDTQIAKLGDTAYETASKYGVAANEYLQSVATFAKAGYGDAAEQLGELATKTQLVGDVTADVASKFLLSADAAFEFNGNIAELSTVLDKANVIENNYATSIEKLAEGFPIVASTAAMANMSIDETMAAIGTITAVTQESGTKASTALRALILNIMGSVGAEIEEGVTVTEESVKSLDALLVKYAPDAVAAANATGSIIDPMEAIYSLSKAAEEGLMTEAELADFLSSLGGKLRTNQLTALVENWGMMEEMLSKVKDSAGSADKEVETMLGSWESKSQILSNTWTQFLSNFVETDTVKDAIDALTNILEGLNDAIAGGVTNARTLQDELAKAYNEEFGSGTRYDELINKQEELNKLEEYELYLLEQRKRAIEQEQASAKQIEFDEWQKQYGYGKTQGTWFEAGGASFFGADTKDRIDLRDFQSELNALNEGLSQGKLAVSEYSEGLGDLALKYSDTVAELKAFSDEGMNLSESQDLLINGFDALITAGANAENVVAQYGLAVLAYYQAMGYGAEEAVAMAKQGMEDFSEQIETLPEEKETEIETNSEDEAKKVESLIALINDIPHEVQIAYTVAGVPIPYLNAHETGTQDAPGGPTLVNEKGPELISANGLAYIAGNGKPTITNLPKGATVLNAEQTAQAVRGLKNFGKVPALQSGTMGTHVFSADTGTVRNKSTVYSDALPLFYQALSGAYVAVGGAVASTLNAAIKEADTAKSSTSTGSAAAKTSSNVLSEAALNSLRDDLDSVLNNLKAQAELADNQGLHDKEGNLYGQAQEKIKELLEKYRAAGYSETSDEILELENMLYDYAEEQKDAYQHTWDELEDGLDSALSNINAQIEKAENENDVAKQMELYGQAQEKIAELLNRYIEAGYALDSDEVLRLTNLNYDYAAKQIGARDDALDTLIDALNALKDSADDSNSLAEKQQAVENAQEALKNAQSQRTVRIFNPVTGQWEWIANAADIETAQKNLETAEKNLRDEQFNQEIAALKNGGGEDGSFLNGQGVSTYFDAASAEQQAAVLKALGAYTGAVNLSPSTQATSIGGSSDSHDVYYSFNGISISAEQARSMTLEELANQLQILKLT